MRLWGLSLMTCLVSQQRIAVAGFDIIYLQSTFRHRGEESNARSSKSSSTKKRVVTWEASVRSHAPPGAATISFPPVFWNSSRWLVEVRKDNERWERLPQLTQRSLGSLVNAHPLAVSTSTSYLYSVQKLLCRRIVTGVWAEGTGLSCAVLHSIRSYFVRCRWAVVNLILWTRGSGTGQQNICIRVHIL